MAVVAIAVASATSWAQYSASPYPPYNWCNNMGTADPNPPRCVATRGEILTNYDAYLHATNGIPATCTAAGGVVYPLAYRLLLGTLRGPTEFDSGVQFVQMQTSCNGDPWSTYPRDDFYRAGICYVPTQKWSAPAGTCVETLDRARTEGCSPSVGESMYLLTGVKKHVETLGALAFADLTVGYDTQSMLLTEGGTTPAFRPEPAPSYGALWYGSLHRNIVVQPAVGSAGPAVHVWRGDGKWVTFLPNGVGGYVPDANVRHRLWPLAAGAGWQFTDADAGTIETYNSGGQLIGIVGAGGKSLSYVYSTSSTPPANAPEPGLLIQVQDQFSRTIQFDYEKPGSSKSRIYRQTDVAGQVTMASYDDAGNLIRLTWPDANFRDFVYETASIPWALTGVVDEKRLRSSTYGYDAEGRAAAAERAGGVDHYQLSYTTPPRWNVIETYDSTSRVLWRDHAWQLPVDAAATNPSGSTTAFVATTSIGTSRLASRSQPAGSGCGASTSNASYDSNGNVASADDFNGNRTCYANDLSRNLETVRVEGLSNTASCSAVTAAGVTLSAPSRKITSQWHPDWRLQTKLAEPRKLTTWVYNGQPDPFNGGAIASCAPSTALLPDGKPIVVLCKQVEQATTDTDGHLGMSAALQSGVANRQQSWSYNQYGQVLTAKGPRTDVNDTTTYAYYGDTTADHTLGDLSRVTNPAGQVTQYQTYNKTGQVLHMVDANGIVTDNTYDLRQRLTSTTSGGLKTSYTYDRAGQLTKLTLPDGTAVSYTWDAAHRLTKVTDQAGNSIIYTLDNSGNRTKDQIKDPHGNLARTVSRAFDALGRVQKVSGAVQ